MDSKKTILKKALAQARVTELEAFVLIQQIFEENKAAITNIERNGR